MAKPIEIAFTAIRNHPSIRNLKAIERGIYMGLVQCNLLDGIEPLPKQQNELARLSGASIPQWNSGGKGALKAFNATIDHLNMLYQKQVSVRKVKSVNAKVHFKDSNSKRHLALLAKRNSLKNVSQYLSEQSTAPVPMQPTKSPPKKPQNIDHIARLAAKNTVNAVKSGAKPVNRLVDKG